MCRILAILALLWIGAPALAADPPASTQSVRELLAVTKTQRSLDVMRVQIRKSFERGMQQAMQGQEVPPEVQRAADAYTAKLAALFDEELAWEHYEPLFVDIYARHFTQPQVDALVAFYRSPAGAAYIDQLPAILQESMDGAQTRMGTLMPKLKKLQEEAIAEIKSAAAAAAGGAAADKSAGEPR
ncbi:MAG: DUF2059 domain-containing protein [Proteobacteria bacterium]|nr:DUF2059 domain-containing protein [Pseudomonadota bacterium]